MNYIQKNGDIQLQASKQIAVPIPKAVEHLLTKTLERDAVERRRRLSQPSVIFDHAKYSR